jgi:PAS domain S-box-containing protein
MYVTSQRTEQYFGVTDANTKSEVVRTDFQKTADDIILSKYSPAGVVVNEALDIVHFRGNTSNYLAQSSGKPSHNLLKMAKHGLGFELRNILHKTKKEKALVRKENIPMEISGNLWNISIECIPLTNTIEPHYLILFHDQHSSGESTVSVRRKGTAGDKLKKDDKDLRIEQLEHELEQVREDMRSITEDQEAANEELQSANEELLSTSEELQSLNEELETNKEELQSTNEELTIINHEVISLNEIVTDARDYAEAIIATIHEPMIILDENIRVRSANKSFYKYFGVKEEETEGIFLYDLGNKQWDIPHLHQLLDDIIPRNAQFQGFEITHNFPGIGEKIMLLNASRIIQKTVQEHLILLAIEDVTDQKIVENQLIEAKIFAELATTIAESAKSKAEIATAAAEEAVNSKQKFLSNMSHEIRTPMNAIIGFTKVLLKTEMSEKQREYLDAIKTSGDTMIVLINDILDLAKVNAGKMNFEKVPFKLMDSLSAMLHLFETKIQEKNLALIKEFDNNIPEVLLGDPVRLHQIILNLVGNAVKFTDKGQITISTIILHEDDKEVRVEIAVKDTGIGIPEKTLGNIFDNFHQASNDTSRLYGGTGLGLAIVKQLVELQGGTISATSRLGEGSEFGFVLAFEKAGAAPQTITDQILPELIPVSKQIKVLVVEDMHLNQLLMKTLLDDFGFERQIAANGKIAIELLQKNTYDIVLMDLQMPEMNGFEATAYIRETLKSEVPIIALTADVTTIDLAKCKAVGMNDYIAKPVNEQLLYDKIVRLTLKP